MSDRREPPTSNLFRGFLIAAVCALLHSGCDKKPKPVAYTGESVHWRKAGSVTMSCDTFRPDQYPFPCIQISGERRRFADSNPPPEPEVPAGVFYPDYDLGLDEGVNLPRPRMSVSVFEKDEQRAGGERYYGPNAQFSGTVRVAGLPTDNVAGVTIHRDHITLNSSKVVSLDDFRIDDSQRGESGKHVLHVSPLFDEMSMFVDRKKRELKLLGEEYEVPTVTVFADRDVPFAQLEAVLYTLSRFGTTDFHFLVESDRQSRAVHCAHFDDDRPQPAPVKWWRCYEKSGAHRVATELEFVDIGALGPVRYEAPGHLEPDQVRYENMIFIDPQHGFIIVIDNAPVEADEDCDGRGVTICTREGELDYAALHAFFREGHAAGADAFVVRPAGRHTVTYEQMLTTTQVLARPSPTRSFSDTDELFTASRSDEVELTPLVSRVAWAGRMSKRR